jgi:hypothetical protein
MPLLRTAPAVEALLANADAAWTWWTGELAACVPPRLRRRSASRHYSNIRLAPQGVTIEQTVEGSEQLAFGRPLADFEADDWAALSAAVAGTRPRIALGVPDIYWTEIRLPVAARARLASAVALQLAQIAPIAPALLTWKAQVVASDTKAVTALVAMARTARVEALRQSFTAAGLPAPTIVADAGGRSVELVSTRVRGGNPARRDDRRAWMLALLLLGSIPVTTSAIAAVLTRMNESRIASLQTELAPKLETERRIAQTETSGRALRMVFANPAATERIEAIALGVPATDFVTTAGSEVDGSLRLTVDSANAESLQAQIVKSELLAQLQPVDMVPAPDRPERVQVSYGGTGP